MYDINGKVALITGGAQGMGFAFAKELLKSGLKGVSLIDVDVINGEKAALELEDQFKKYCAIFIQANVAEEIELEEAFKVTVEKFKQLDIVINNAGITQEIQWRKCVETNLLGTVIGSKLAMENYLPKYNRGNEGVLVNIASVLGIKAIEPVPIYVATKHAVVGFSRSISGPVHYQDYKVRVLCVCPGITKTAMFYGFSAEQQHEPFRTMMNKLGTTLVRQSAEDVAIHLVQLIKDAPSGSVWTVIKGVRQHVQFASMEDK